MADRCSTCKFFDTTSAAAPRNDRLDTEIVWGLCRFNPPMMLLRPGRLVWATVTSEDWCGQYQENVNGG